MADCTPRDGISTPLKPHPRVKDDVPLTLMRMALAILDRDGQRVPACYLQQAIDSYLDTPPAKPGAQLDAEINAWLEDNAEVGDPG